MSHDRLYISVQTTAYCQLACDYCGQEHSKLYLDDNVIDMISKRIREKITHSSYKILEIGWFGGEPLLALGKMRKLNDELKKIAKELNISYIGHITTNGYFLTPALYNELKVEFNIKRIEITLDGTAEYHDKRRCTVNQRGSFNRIFDNLTRIASSSEYDLKTCVISVRCNVDKRNINGVLPLLKLIVEKGIQKKIMFYTTPVVSWSNNGAGDSLSKELLGYKSTEYLTYMIENGFKTELLPHRMKPYLCLATDPLGDFEMYDASGNIFDCSETSYITYYRNKGYVLGNVSDHNLTNQRSCLKDMPRKLLNGQIEPCNKCKFYPVCGGLCALGLSEKEPRCPSFIYNIEDRMLLYYISKKNVNIVEQ